MSAQSPPPYWHPVVHSMTRRNQQNNYHAGHKAYMITLKIESMAPLLGRIVSTATSRGITLLPLGEAMRTAWLTLPQRFHNISIIDSPEEYVIMPEHFHGIIYATGYMQEHLSDIVKLFKSRVAMSYRKLMIEEICQPVGSATQWLSAYNALPAETKAATAEWIEHQLAALYSATSRRIKDMPPFKVATSGSHSKQGFLFASGYTDSLLLNEENLEGHREYILNNPKSRLQRTCNRSRLKVNRIPIDTAVTIQALDSYLHQQCPYSDVTEEKLAAVHAVLLSSDVNQSTSSAISQSVSPVSPSCHPVYSATSRRIICHSYGDRALLQCRLLPLVCHRKDAHLFGKQLLRCKEEAAKGAVIISACISKGEQAIFKELQQAGYPVIKIEDNGFPEIYHPSQERIDLCDVGRLLIVTPWQYHYRHKDENIFVAYCKTMNCIAQAFARLKDDWWKV